MQEQQLDQKIMFKNLLEKMYEKGETEKEISAKELMRDLEIELRSILAYK